ncbi:hypothetical protein HMPREF2928_04700 [Rothia sp. HMSC072B04]|uniref:Uncharacterized protein n=1 Tax=Rothia mucilaginosa TaxID=43675 RepID=A0A291DH06_9MICC|nr:hypothetical protein CO690_08315 [Rothia mucilaginosa]OFJ79970.1 hypothetical protein HMPREF2842_03640 [Rothia sp. HMSC069C10]OFL76503.1 hypothetical protein HMPREF2749_05140 [Rothia sp. HMSC075F09]OFN73790.1 hypothetical protein HMPREF2528_00990 [Rothia sp. HMSC078H08]OFQ59569.1 hypothetical protein HMPREF2928_04700 [Rothia sp. HMSC072B04]OFQ74516.1 hypothetical protein HMPREF2919_03240 [Rothia sp. HMSC068E02]
MRAREAVIAGLPLYSPRVHRGFLAVASFIQGVRRYLSGGVQVEARIEVREEAQAEAFRLIHKYLHHLA